VFISFFFALKVRLKRPQVLSFVSLSWNRITDKLAINWNKFAPVRLYLKFAFIIRPDVSAILALSFTNVHFIVRKEMGSNFWVIST